MGNLETLEAFRHTVDHFTRLFRVEPQAVACDLHPDYLSTRWAREYAKENTLELIQVQHHHAHIASMLAEHQMSYEQRVIGIALDGTGYGPDGAIWGGEFLIASCHEFERSAHLRYVPLPGGDHCIRHPFRAALAHLWAAGLAWDERLPCVASCSQDQRDLLRRQLERNVNCPQTSSLGRLFDAVAAILGIRQSVTYEAQAAMELEAVSADIASHSAYPIQITGDRPLIIEVAPWLEAIAADAVAHVARPIIIARFHRTLVETIAQLCQQLREAEGINLVALSGGVFQNQRLLQATVQRLETLDFDVLCHHLVPPNDGGLALGQAMVATARLASAL